MVADSDVAAHTASSPRKDAVDPAIQEMPVEEGSIEGSTNPRQRGNPDKLSHNVVSLPFSWNQTAVNESQTETDLQRLRISNAVRGRNPGSLNTMLKLNTSSSKDNLSILPRLDEAIFDVFLPSPNPSAPEVEVASRSNNVKVSGWLVKRGHTRQNFKRRFFVLCGSILEYFEDNTCSKRRGGVDISGDDVSLTVLDNNGTLLMKGGYELLFYACDGKDQKRWISALHKVNPDIKLMRRRRSGDSSQEADSVRCGWLTKRGHLVKSYQRRWFVLKNLNLEYFLDPNCVTKKGEVHLSGDGVSVSFVDIRETKNSFSFGIFRNDECVLMCYADSQEEREEWVAALRPNNCQTRSFGDSEGDEEDLTASPVGSPSRSSEGDKNFVDDDKSREIRKEIRSLLASPYEPEGKTLQTFVKDFLADHRRKGLELISNFVRSLSDFVTESRLKELKREGKEELVTVADRETIKGIAIQEVEAAVFYPLQAIIYRKLSAKGKAGKNVVFQEKRSFLRQKPQAYFEIEESKTSPTDWKSVVLKFNEISRFSKPSSKKAALVAAANEIYACYKREHPCEDAYREGGEASFLGGDDFVPIFIFSLLRSDIEDLLTLKRMLVALNVTRAGEDEYYLACLEMAVEFISTFDLAREGLPSIPEIPRLIQQEIEKMNNSPRTN